MDEEIIEWIISEQTEDVTGVRCRSSEVGKTVNISSRPLESSSPSMSRSNSHTSASEHRSHASQHDDPTRSTFDFVILLIIYGR